jgi:hypothetical protein
MQQRKNNKASDMNNTEWQTQVQQLIMNWTPRHMDTHLTTPEVALEWIVDPG